MDIFLCIQVTQPHYNSIHPVRPYFTSFSFQLWMESNNNRGVEERLRKQEGKKPTMPPYYRSSCLKSQEQWEEEHLSWIKDGNIHWMEIFN